MCLTQVTPISWGAALSPPIPDAREGAASRYTGLSAALLAESAMQRPSLLCGLAVRALRPTGHREASALGRTAERQDHNL